METPILFGLLFVAVLIIAVFAYALWKRPEHLRASEKVDKMLSEKFEGIDYLNKLVRERHEIVEKVNSSLTPDEEIADETRIVAKPWEKVDLPNGIDRKTILSTIDAANTLAIQAEKASEKAVKLRELAYEAEGRAKLNPLPENVKMSVEAKNKAEDAIAEAIKAEEKAVVMSAGIDELQTALAEDDAAEADKIVVATQTALRNANMVMVGANPSDATGPSMQDIPHNFQDGRAQLSDGVRPSNYDLSELVLRRIRTMPPVASTADPSAVTTKAGGPMDITANKNFGHGFPGYDINLLTDIESRDRQVSPYYQPTHSMALHFNAPFYSDPFGVHNWRRNPIAKEASGRSIPVGTGAARVISMMME